MEGGGFFCKLGLCWIVDLSCLPSICLNLSKEMKVGLRSHTVKRMMTMSEDVKIIVNCKYQESNAAPSSQTVQC